MFQRLQTRGFYHLRRTWEENLHPFSLLPIRGIRLLTLRQLAVALQSRWYYPPPPPPPLRHRPLHVILFLLVRVQARELAITK